MFLGQILRVESLAYVVPGLHMHTYTSKVKDGGVNHGQH